TGCALSKANTSFLTAPTRAKGLPRWAQLDLNQRPSDYELYPVELFRVASGRHRLRYPCFHWVSRWRPATPHNSTQLLRTEKLAKNWPSMGRRQAPLRVFARLLVGYVPIWGRALCSSYIYPLLGCAQMPVHRGHV